MIKITAIINWIKNLIFIILFTSILEMLLPNNGMKKYLRVVLGFFIISIFISPLTLFLRQDYGALYQIQPAKINEYSWAEIEAKGEELEQDNMEVIKEYYATRIGERVKEIVNLDFYDYEKIVKVKIGDNYQLEKIDIILSKENEKIKEINISPIKIGEKIEDKNKKLAEEKVLPLKRSIANIFQIPANKVNIYHLNGGGKD